MQDTAVYGTFEDDQVLGMRYVDVPARGIYPVAGVATDELPKLRDGAAVKAYLDGHKAYIVKVDA